MGAPGTAIAQEISARARVIPQAFDDDCGLAALAMLLRNAGADVTPEHLAAGLRSDAREDALSGTDLIEMTANSGTGFELTAGFVPISGLQALAERESVIILMRPRSFGGADGFDHFVVVDRRVGESFLVADPVLPERALLSSELIERDAHGRSIDGRPYIMVFRLVRNGAGAAPALSRVPDDVHARPWEDLYRLPRPLPEGKLLIESTIAQSTFRQDLGAGLAIEDRTVTRSVSIARGMGRQNQISLDLINSDGDARLRVPGSSFSLGEFSGSVAGLTWTTFHDWPLPLDAAAVTHVGAIWTELGAPDIVSAQLQLDTRSGNWGARIDNELAINLDLDDIHLITTPVVSYSHVLPLGLAMESNLVLEIEDFDAADRVYGRLSVSKIISPTVSVSAFYEHELLERDRTSDNQFGLSFALAVPRPMRRARSQ